MRNLELDALLKANRLVTRPPRGARERIRGRLLARIGAGAAAVAGVLGGEGYAQTAGGSGTMASGTVGHALAAVTGTLVRWPVIALALAALPIGAGVYVARGRAEVARSAIETPGNVPSAFAERPSMASVDGGQEVETRSSSAAPEPMSPPPMASSSEASVAMPSGVHANSRPPARSPAVESQSLARELELLRSARRALDTGSPEVALALLDIYASEHPHGALRPEFETTRVLSLCAAGRVGAAQKARDQFLRSAPRSPLAESLRKPCPAGRR